MLRKFTKISRIYFQISYFQEVQNLLVNSIDVIETPSELESVMFEPVMVEVTTNPQLLEKVEKKAMTLLDLMNPVELYRLLYFLTLNKHAQSFELIYNIKTKLLARPISFDKIKLRNMFFACCVLKVYDERLLTAMSENLIDVLSNSVFQDQKTVAFPVLKSCFRLGWRHEELMDLLMKMVETVSTEFTPAERLSLIDGIGHLKLNESDKLVVELISDMSEFKNKKPELHLKIVRAFAIMRQVDGDMITAVLQKDFYNGLIQSLKG